MHSKVKASQIKMLLPEMKAIFLQSTPSASLPEPDMMPMTTARPMMPSTSSMTAAAMMDEPSGVSMLCLSDRILAVIPTDVAVQRMPRKRHRGSENWA